MNSPPKRNPPEVPDDATIPILTERLGLPPLDFDTTLPLIDTTSMSLDTDLEGLTALPDPPMAAFPAPMHPVAALPPVTQLPPVTPPAPPAAPVVRAREPAAARAAPGQATPTIPPSNVPPAPPAPAPAVRVAPPATAPVIASLPITPPAMPLPELTAFISATAPLPAGNDGRHWDRLEGELRAAVLRQITAQLPREIDAIVQNQMLGAMDRLLAGLADEMRRAVAIGLQDIVEHAVRAELDRLRHSNRGVL